jgi:hypothetical protein
MAFYAYNAAHPAPMPIAPSGLGAFYAYDATHEAVLPINQLSGVLGPSGTLSDEAIRELTQGRKPVAVVTEWAEAKTDTRWVDSSSPNELVLIPITDADLAKTKRMAFGHDLPMVAIVGTEPARLALAEQAFAGTPYKFMQALSVRAIGDMKPMPTALFLWIGKDREPGDGEGARGLLDDTARALRGKLVHLIALPKKQDRASVPGFQEALQLQFPPRSSAPPRAPFSPAPPPTPSVVRLGPAQHGFQQSGLGMSGTSLALIAGAVVVVGAAGYLLKDKL